MAQIQIFGTKKCNNTRKMERFFKERGITFQFINLSEKAISKGELASIKSNVPLKELIDTDGKEYAKKNLSYMEYDTEEILLENPLLFKTPVVRDGKKATVGYQPEIWKKWLKNRE